MQEFPLESRRWVRNNKTVEEASTLRARSKRFLYDSQWQKGGIMKRTLIAAALLSLAFAVPAFAVEGSQPSTAPGKTFEERQANILKMIDERITSLQEGKACVQAAKSDSDLKACREKHVSEMKGKRGAMRHERGMMGGPQDGMGGPQGQ